MNIYWPSKWNQGIARVGAGHFGPILLLSCGKPICCRISNRRRNSLSSLLARHRPSSRELGRSVGVSNSVENAISARLRRNSIETRGRSLRGPMCGALRETFCVSGWFVVRWRRIHQSEPTKSNTKRHLRMPSWCCSQCVVPISKQIRRPAQFYKQKERLEIAKRYT